MYRTLLRVKPKKTNLSKNRLTVTAPGWKGDKENITIDPATVPADILAKIKEALTGTDTIYLFAEMNLGADYVKDLVFDNFVFAPKPRFDTLEEYYAKPTE